MADKSTELRAVTMVMTVNYRAALTTYQQTTDLSIQYNFRTTTEMVNCQPETNSRFTEQAIQLVVLQKVDGNWISNLMQVET